MEAPDSLEGVAGNSVPGIPPPPLWPSKKHMMHTPTPAGRMIWAGHAPPHPWGGTCNKQSGSPTSHQLPPWEMLEEKLELGKEGKGEGMA